MTKLNLVSERPSLSAEAEQAGEAWAAQFVVDGDEATQIRLRGLVASAFAAGWMTGYQASVADLRESLGAA